VKYYKGLIVSHGILNTPPQT